jgi:thiazole synthase
MRRAVEASGAEIVTVAVRRVNVTDPSQENLLDYLDPKQYDLAEHCRLLTAEEAIRSAAWLARESGIGDLVKLVIGDPKTLFPDVLATLEAARVLEEDGFSVLPRHGRSHRLQAPRAARLPGGDAASPRRSDPGSASAIPTTYGSPRAEPGAGDRRCGGARPRTQPSRSSSAATLCDEHRHRRRARSCRWRRRCVLAVEAGRKAFLAGRIGKKLYATASSPLEQMIE